MAKEIQFLTIEVGSTITKVNGFRLLPEGRFEHLAQGFAPTSVTDGDVRVGVDRAIVDLESRFGKITGKTEKFVNSSAAGGLRMTVHGLTYSMTARAAHEAALGAGAIVKMVTAGDLGDYELDEIRSIAPNIILLAGGVDFGEKEIVLRNAEKLALLGISAPVVYAGNSALRKPVEKIFKDAGLETIIAENVFPEVDVLNIEPLRKVIHDVFNRHIIHAPGMSALAEMTSNNILPTPGAVLNGAELFAEAMGDCLVFDVGGATTDVHSVTDGSPAWTSKLIEPEPRAKRSVEGDLGVYINAHNIVDQANDNNMASSLDELEAIPVTQAQKSLTHWLCEKAVIIAIRRHAGTIMDIYTPSGKKQLVKGKDLTAIKWIIGTGGALTRLDGGEEILQQVCLGPGKFLLPNPGTAILMDRNYLFSALGTLAQAYPDAVRATFKYWVEQESV